MIAVADDLSGAAETAAAFGVPSRVELVTDGDRPDSASFDGVRVFDLDVRYAPASSAEKAFRGVLGAHAGGLRFVKVDSLLRGNLAAAVRAARPVAPAIVFAPALPSAGRTVVGGVPLIGGVPLVDTGLWRSEAGRPPASVAEALPDLAVRLVPLAEVRAGALPEILAEASRDQRIVAPDAETDADLSAIVEAAWSRTEQAVLVGSRGLAEAAARFGGFRPAPAPRETSPRAVVVVGSADETAHRQFERLLDDLAPARAQPHPRALLSDAAAPAELGRERVSAVRISPGERVAAEVSHQLAERFAAHVAEALSHADLSSLTLVLIGGETARLLLERLGAHRIDVLGTDGGGIVFGSAAMRDGRRLRVVTRPGSFGDDEQLVDLVRSIVAPDHSLSPAAGRESA